MNDPPFGFETRREATDIDVRRAVERHEQRERGLYRHAPPGRNGTADPSVASGTTTRDASEGPKSPVTEAEDAAVWSEETVIEAEEASVWSEQALLQTERRPKATDTDIDRSIE